MSRKQPPKNGRARRLWDLTDEEVAELFERGRARTEELDE